MPSASVGGPCFTGSMLNTRELASLILLGGFLAFSFTRADVRESARAVFKSFFSLKILVPVLIYVALVSGLVWVASWLDLWNSELLGATILWGIFSGLALLFSVNDAGKDSQFFRKRARRLVAGAALFEFFLNIRTFNLAVELVLVFVVTVLTMLRVVAGHKDEFVNVRGPIDVLLGLLVLGLLTATLAGMITDWRSIDHLALGRSLLLPIWLTLSTLPYVYLLAVFAGYELAFMRLEFANNRAKPPLRAKLAVAAELRGRVTALFSFGGPRARATAEADFLYLCSSRGSGLSRRSCAKAVG